MTVSFDEIRRSTLDEVDELAREAEITYSELVLPGWGTANRHGFPRTLYGYVMSAFALIDLLSLYHSRYEKPQSKRMVQFMVDYLGSTAQVSKAAVQLWRHTLMHTSIPRTLSDGSSGTNMLWLLHWREHLPRAQHMQLISGGRPDEQILNMGAMYLLSDLQVGAQRLFVNLASSAQSQAEVESMHMAMLANQKIPA